MSEKVSIGKHLPPMVLPVCLLGSNVDGKANFTAIAWFTMIDDEPPTIGLVLGKGRFAMEGIRQNGTFSVNIPGEGLAAKTDYCGLHSGSEVDKSKVFKVAYGVLETAPLIEDCPVAVECRYIRTIEFEGSDLVIGEVEEVHVEASIIRDGKADVNAMAPLLYSMGSAQYLVAGRKVADAYKVGKTYRPGQ